MPRPCKRRRVCAMPGCGRFGPVEGNTEQRVIMSVDEFEAIRLIDYEGLTQEACAERMEVARTTAQAIYAAARSKLAECLVAGKELVIEGGPICAVRRQCKRVRFRSWVHAALLRHAARRESAGRNTKCASEKHYIKKE